MINVSPSARASTRITTIRCSATSPKASPPASSQLRNSLGALALVFSGGWDRKDAERAISGVKLAGYDFIEIPLLNPDSVDAAMTRTLLQTHGVSATASLGLRLDADISSEDNGVAAAGEALLMSALHCAASFGSKYLCGVIYSAIAKYPGPPTVQGRRNCVAALRRVADVAANDYDIILCAEIINRYESNILNTASQGVELVADVGAANFKLHLDSFHMNIEENSLSGAVATAGDLLGYVHIGESHRG